MFDANTVFSDMKISEDIARQCKAILFNEQTHNKGVNFVANEIAPLLPQSMDIFPESLMEHMEKISWGSSPFFITLLTYLNTYSAAFSFENRMKTVGKVGLGLEIMNAHKKCFCCSEMDGKKYPWSKLSEMPSLPLHWGCSCTVRVYFK